MSPHPRLLGNIIFCKLGLLRRGGWEREKPLASDRPPFSKGGLEGVPVLFGRWLQLYPGFVLERRRSLSRIISVKSAAGRISKGPAFTPGCFDINSTA